MPFQNHQESTNGIMRYWSSLFESVDGMTKSDLRAAINATDNWIDSNQASYNNALPATAKANLTLAQKTLLFCSVSAYRVSANFVKKLFGEID